MGRTPEIERLKRIEIIRKWIADSMFTPDKLSGQIAVTWGTRQQTARDYIRVLKDAGEVTLDSEGILRSEKDDRNDQPRAGGVRQPEDRDQPAPQGAGEGESGAKDKVVRVHW